MQAKKRAMEEGTTLTDILVQGLKARLDRSRVVRELPVSHASGGLAQGVSWDRLEAAGDQEENHR